MRETSLIQRGAAPDANSQLCGGGDRRHILLVQRLVCQAVSFCHRKIEGQLDEAEMMVVATHFARDRCHPGQADVFARSLRDTEPVPGCQAVITELSGFALAL